MGATLEHISLGDLGLDAVWIKAGVSQLANLLAVECGLRDSHTIIVRDWIDARAGYTITSVSIIEVASSGTTHHSRWHRWASFEASLLLAAMEAFVVCVDSPDDVKSLRRSHLLDGMRSHFVSYHPKHHYDPCDDLRVRPKRHWRMSNMVQVRDEATPHYTMERVRREFMTVLCGQGVRFEMCEDEEAAQEDRCNALQKENDDETSGKRG